VKGSQKGGKERGKLRTGEVSVIEEAENGEVGTETTRELLIGPELFKKRHWTILAVRKREKIDKVT
jgi:hypothetical protein